MKFNNDEMIEIDGKLVPARIAVPLAVASMIIALPIALWLWI